MGQTASALTDELQTATKWAAQADDTKPVVTLLGIGLGTQGAVHCDQLIGHDWRQRRAEFKEAVFKSLMDEVLARAPVSDSLGVTCKSVGRQMQTGGPKPAGFQPSFDIDVQLGGNDRRNGQSSRGSDKDLKSSLAGRERRRRRLVDG